MSTRNERRAQFWIQGTTDFNKGKDPRWSTSHPHYVDYIQGYEHARKESKRKAREYRREHSWLTKTVRKVKAWLLNS